MDRFQTPCSKLRNNTKATWIVIKLTHWLLHIGHIPFYVSIFVHFYTPFAVSPISLPHRLIPLYFPLNFAVFPCPFLHTSTRSHPFIPVLVHDIIQNLLCNFFISKPLLLIRHGTYKLAIQSLIPSFPNPCCFTTHWFSPQGAAASSPSQTQGAASWGSYSHRHRPFAWWYIMVAVSCT